jgi:hypothetical protein
VELGDEVKGAITISVQEEFDASEIRAELRCVEKRRRERWVYDEERRRKVRRVYWDSATLHSADPKVADQLHLLPGFKKTFPFHVNVPAGGRESFDSLDGHITWYIKAVVGVKGRPDATSKVLELQVIRPAGSKAAREKEVIMIPCEYCETLMPETSTSCPNCGAPRKK